MLFDNKLCGMWISIMYNNRLSEGIGHSPPLSVQAGYEAMAKKCCLKSYRVQNLLPFYFLQVTMFYILSVSLSFSKFLTNV